MSYRGIILVLGQMALLCALCAYLFATAHPVAASFALAGALATIHTLGSKSKTDAEDQ